MSVFTDRRRFMVESQLRTNKVTSDRLIIAFENTAKENYIDDDLSELAYIDEDLMLPSGRFILEPMVFARMVQALELKSTDAVLDIGSTSGYSTAILSKLSQSVVGIESDTDLAQQAQDNLTSDNVDNAVVINASHVEGLAKEAPYNAILINGAVQSVPEGLLSQLAEDGRLIAVIRDDTSSPGRVVKYVRAGKGNSFAKTTLFDAQTPILDEFSEEKPFSF